MSYQIPPQKKPDGQNFFLLVRFLCNGQTAL